MSNEYGKRYVLDSLSSSSFHALLILGIPAIYMQMVNAC